MSSAARHRSTRPLHVRHPAPGWVAAALLPTLCSTGGCYLPLGTAAPQGSTTVGKGAVGFTAYGEVPAVDLAGVRDSTSNTGGGSYRRSPLPTLTTQLSYGLAGRLDLEVGLDAALYGVLPLPVGGWGGLRLGLLRSRGLGVATALRGGYAGLSVERDETDAAAGDDSGAAKVHAFHGAASVAMELFPEGRIRPGVTLSAMPARISLERTGGPEHLWATGLGATAAVQFAGPTLTWGPFVHLLRFTADDLAGTGHFVTGGLLASYRH